MATETLVDNLIADGQKLIDQLPQSGFEVTAAFWVHASENYRWYFYIVAPAVDSEGIAKAYEQLQAVIRQMPPPFGIGLLGVRLIGPSNPIARNVLGRYREASHLRGRPFRLRNGYLGMATEEAYFYPLPPGVTP
jgi:hypothetical protein